MKPYTLKWVISKENDGTLLREFLIDNKGISRRSLTDIKFNGGGIFVNGKQATVRYSLNASDVVEIHFPPESRGVGMVPEPIPFDIVYEDEYLLIINKRAGLPVIPSREHPSGTLANAVLHYYDKINLNYTFHIVNRLDRDTSGLLIVAKTRHVHYLLTLEQKKGTIKRRYEALVEGFVQQDSKTINASIGRKENSIIERTVTPDGQHAITHFQVIKRFKDYTWVSVQLETGRTHQIRVHFSHIGHPLLGDDLYGGSTALISRQALHSTELTFWHPILEKEINHCVELPKDMRSLI